MKPDRIKPFVSCLQPALAEAGSAQQTLLCTNLINRGGEDESGAINTAPSRGQGGTAWCHSWVGDPGHHGGATWEAIWEEKGDFWEKHRRGDAEPLLQCCCCTSFQKANVLPQCLQKTSLGLCTTEQNVLGVGWGIWVWCKGWIRVILLWGWGWWTDKCHLTAPLVQWDIRWSLCAV